MSSLGINRQCTDALRAWWGAVGAAAAAELHSPPRVHRRAPLTPPRLAATLCSNITIPATFVTKSTGDALKALMKGGQPVYVVMDWQDILPRKQQVCCVVLFCAAGRPSERVIAAGCTGSGWGSDRPAGQPPTC